MKHACDCQLNVRGRLLDLKEPQVMGILNCTPDSFYASSRVQEEHDIAARAEQIIQEGGSMIDVGACSTRPGGDIVDEAEETRRIRHALRIVRRVYPDAIVSIDTFRPTVARMAIEEFGADIINDVSGGNEEMYQTVARYGVPYVLTSTEPDIRRVLLDFARRVQMLRDLGQKDIILDPGFGFGKTPEQNCRLMGELEKLEVIGLPVLVGVSRKSMIWKTLGITPEESLNGTTVMNTVALQKGASILRVHDVKVCVEVVRCLRSIG